MYMEKIKVIIAEQNESRFKEINEILINEEDIVFVGRGRNRSETIELIQKKQPNVLVTDVDLEVKGDNVGLDIAIECAILHPETKILIMSETLNESTVRSTVGLGVSNSYLLRKRMYKLADAIRRTYNGTCHLEKEVQVALMKDYKKSLKNTMARLTKHHLFVLKLFYDGLTVQQVAKQLNVEIQSVRNLNQEIRKRCMGWEWGTKNLTIQDIANRAKLLGLFRDRYSSK